MRSVVLKSFVLLAIGGFFVASPQDRSSSQAQDGSQSQEQSKNCAPQDPPPPVDTEWLKAQQDALAALDPAFVSDIRHLMDVLGLRQTLQRSMSAQMNSLKTNSMPLLKGMDHPEQIADSVITKMSGVLTEDRFLDEYVMVYARHFSREEIRQILAFYESPTGRKCVSEQSSLFGDIQTQGHLYMQKIVIPKVVAEVQKEVAAHCHNQK